MLQGDVIIPENWAEKLVKGETYGAYVSQVSKISCK